MELLSGRPFWPVRDGLPASFPPLSGNESCDVAVIGAGITGAIVAWHLADAGFDVVVLDRREAAHGSTAGSTNMIQYELDRELCRLAADFGAERATRCYRRMREAVAGLGTLVRRLRLDCGFERKRSLYLASTRRDVDLLRREYSARGQAGFDVAWWNRSRLARESDLPHAAAILSGDAAQVDSYRLAYGLLGAARRRGARVFDRTAALRICPRRGGVSVVTDRRFRVQARNVVLASGYEGEGFAPAARTRLHSTFAFASEPVGRLDGWPADRCLLWETRRPYCYARTTEDGRILMGGLDEPYRDPERRERAVVAKVARLRRTCARWFPRIPLEVSAGWAGTFAETDDSLPFIGPHPAIDRTWVALGYGANGITFSVIAAQMIVEGLSGLPVRDADIFGFNRMAHREQPAR